MQHFTEGYTKYWYQTQPAALQHGGAQLQLLLKV